MRWMLLLLAVTSLYAQSARESQAHACRYPYRTFDAQSIIDLTPLFLWRTNADAVYIYPPGFSDWYLIVGRVSSVPREPHPDIVRDRSGLLIEINKNISTEDAAGNSLQSIVRLLNYPHDPKKLIDGSPVACFARPNGRYQYRTVGGATATVLSYDHGIIPMHEQIAAIEALKRSNYLARIRVTNIYLTNTTNKPFHTNYSITPRSRSRRE